MQLREALNDIAEIRAQIERTESSRGLRSLAVSFSSLLVFSGAIAGQLILADPGSVLGFVAVWATVAVASLIGALAEMWLRASRSTSRTARGFVWQAHRAMAIQLLPSFVVGAVLTAVFVTRPGMSWILPGMWGLIYGLGLWSCRQHLPQVANWVAVYYVVVGALCLAYSNAMTDLNSGLANWQMVAIFGVGQLLLGFLIYWKLERSDEKED